MRSRILRLRQHRAVEMSFPCLTNSVDNIGYFERRALFALDVVMRVQLHRERGIGWPMSD